MAFHVCAEFGLQCDLVLSLAFTGIVVADRLRHCCHGVMHKRCSTRRCFSTDNPPAALARVPVSVARMPSVLQAASVQVTPFIYDYHGQEQEENMLERRRS